MIDVHIIVKVNTLEGEPVNTITYVGETGFDSRLPELSPLDPDFLE